MSGSFRAPDVGIVTEATISGVYVYRASPGAPKNFQPEYQRRRDLNASATGTGKLSELEMLDIVSHTYTSVRYKGSPRSWLGLLSSY